MRKQVTKRDRKERVPSPTFLNHFVKKSIKYLIEKFKNYTEKHMKSTPEGSQKGAKIDAKTHQKSMPKQVSKKIMKIIKNHVSLKCKTTEIQCKNKCFWWFNGLHVRTVKVSKKTSKVKPKSILKIMKIDTDSILERGIPKTWKSINKSDQKRKWKVRNISENTCQKKKKTCGKYMPHTCPLIPSEGLWRQGTLKDQR